MTRISRKAVVNAIVASMVLAAVPAASAAGWQYSDEVRPSFIKRLTGWVHKKTQSSNNGQGWGVGGTPPGSHGGYGVSFGCKR